ncbi:acyl-CoA dehydrogenase [Frankia gtarii]|uniref:acyl-CoA dehydrogenase n=1 Tax=Frankia gtarii TaxID=2950102 RepID=UPI0021BE7226|nr:acyl-CoA dehydrogenase [Frankia gtarii]
MALAISDDHKALAEVVRTFADANDLRAASRRALDGGPGALGPQWRQIADLGWLGLHLPEEHGGSGFGLAEFAIVAEGLGGRAAAGPLLPTVVASAVVAAVGSPRQQAELLPGLADGSVIASFSSLGAVTADAAGALSGEAPAALGAVWAGIHLVPVGDDLAVVAADSAGLTLRPTNALDPSLGLAGLGLSAVAAHPAGLLRGGRAAAVRILRVVAAAEAVGGARATLDMALDYAKVREQFGRIIGGFQAVKHHLANMLVATELATAATWDAARVAADGAEAELAAAVAAAVALSSYQHNARMNIQLHGGIGFTWEHDAHLYLRRAATLAALAGPIEGAEDDVYALTRDGVRRVFAVELPPEAEQYRREAREFVERYHGAAEAERRDLLVDSGYLVPHWRKPWGREADAAEQLVIDEEFTGIELPNLGIGGWVLLTLTQHGSSEQIERWVLPSLRGELRWCQLFSEPNAGSDAAAVQARAERVEGGWKINGQKVWTSDAQNCNRGLATVRTDPTAPKHKGITAVAIDLSAPGVEVRPLREITGDALFNEVFFDDVFVPDADVVGEINAGWIVARATLGNERVTIGAGHGADEGHTAVGLVDLHARYAAGDTELARRVGRLVAVEVAMGLINLRQVERAVAGSEPSAEGNVSKLLSAEHAQHVTELGMSIAAAAGVTGEQADLAYRYLFARALTIAGGTSEVGRNVIAERILGLPREPNMR